MSTEEESRFMKNAHSATTLVDSTMEVLGERKPLNSHDVFCILGDTIHGVLARCQIPYPTAIQMCKTWGSVLETEISKEAYLERMAEKDK